MNTKLFIATLLIAFVLQSSPAMAYQSGKKMAQRLNDDYRLFNVNFSWGFAERDLLIPVLAIRGLKNGDESSSLGFDIENASGLRVRSGTTTAMVIADLPIENGYYRLKAGNQANFKLLASTQALQLHVSSLPFKFNVKGTETKTFLREHELKDYVTTTI
jgi:hypothetical protein